MPRHRRLSPLLAKLGLAVVAPLAFFALFETGLRLAGFGRNTDFFIPG